MQAKEATIINYYYLNTMRQLITKVRVVLQG